VAGGDRRQDRRPLDVARDIAAKAAQKLQGWWEAHQDAKVRDRLELRAQRQQDGSTTWGLWDGKAKEPKWVEPTGRAGKVFGDELDRRNAHAQADFQVEQARKAEQARELAERQAKEAQERQERTAKREAEQAEIKRLLPEVKWIGPGEKRGTIAWGWSEQLDPTETKRRDNLFLAHKTFTKPKLEAMFKAQEPEAFKAWTKENTQSRGISR
jgi:hypothetical protein